MDPRGTSPSRAGHEHTHTQPYPSRPRKSRHQVSSFISQASSCTTGEPRPPTHLHHNTTHFLLLLCAIPPTQPEFSSAPAEEEQEQGPLEDQMDWIGDKLAMRRQTRSTMGRGLGGKGGAPPIAFVLEFRKARGQQTLCCCFFFYHASTLPRHGGFDIPPSISSSSSLILLHRRGATRVDVVREHASREFQGRAQHVG